KPESFLPAEHIRQQDITTFTLHRGLAIYMANGLQPIGQDAIEVGGKSHEVDILAIAELNDGPDQPTTLLFTKEVGQPDTPLIVHRVARSEDGLISEKAITLDESKKESLRGKEGSGLTLLPADPRHRKWSSISVDGWLYGRITLSEAAHPVYETPRMARERGKRRDRYTRIGAAALAIASFKAVTLPGGIYDHVMDGSNNAQKYVESKLSGLENYDNSTTVIGNSDGTETVIDGNVMTAEYRRAVDRVARSMGDLDGHRFQTIIGRAQRYEQTHKSEIMRDATIKQYQARLAASKNTDQSLAVMDDFLSHFNAVSSVSPTLSAAETESSGFNSDIQYAGTQIIDAFGRLPSSIIKKAIGSNPDIQGGIQFAFGENLGGVNLYGTAVADWDGTNIVLRSTERILGIPMTNYRKTLDHELSHALFGSPLDYSANHTAYSDITTRIENFGSDLLGAPEFTSDYATSSKDEETAEDGSDILRGDITNPDHVLDFTSRSNLTRLKVLVELEDDFPGVTDYILYRLNPRLLDIK
ncbi:MAG TPA: hypothetical protein VFC50_00765, partial [Candidatus Dormibacteraeota bacterium]|nr:hypothetical protein [Candidatus Dormibacteraeota bacterium]